MGQGDNPGEEIFEEGGLERAIEVTDGLEASSAVNELLGCNHIVLSPPQYEHIEKAASVTIDFIKNPNHSIQTNGGD